MALETTIELLALTPDDGKTLGDEIYFSAVLDRMEKNFKHPSIEENLLQENIVCIIDIFRSFYYFILIQGR